MLVKLLMSRAGVDFAQTAGDEIEVDAGEARRMIDAGQAVAVGAPVVERATKKPSEVETRG